MSNNYLLNIIFFVSLILGFIAYEIIGLLLIINEYTEGSCYNLWIYILLSLLIPLALVLLQMCAFPFLFTKIENISFIIFFMTVFGAVSISTCNLINSIWIFGLITLIFQIIITALPFIFKIYTFLCGLKTPCCCCNHYIPEDNNENIGRQNNSNNVIV